MTAWQHIEAAPCGVRLLLWCSDIGFDFRSQRAPRGVVFGRVEQYADGRKAYGEGMNGDWKFTHWMPLPSPPKMEISPDE